jgi:ParB family chromosome partitioning protein
MIKKSGLGRGLGSLIPSKINNLQNKDLLPKVNQTNADFVLPKELEKEVAGQLISEIPVSQIVPNTHQPRHIFDDKALEDLANSIREHGILQPLIVSKISDNGFELVSGERRFRASKLAGLEVVPVIVRTVTLQQKLEIAIIENIQRENLNPIEEAKSYLRLNNEFDLTHEEIAKKVGKSRPQISNMIRLLDLPSEIQDGLTSGKITFGHAKMIASLETDEEKMRLYNSIIEQHLNVREVERKISKSKHSDSRFSSKSIKDINLIEKEEVLREKLMTKVSIIKKGGKGKIQIDYYSNEELNNIIDQILK